MSVPELLDSLGAKRFPQRTEELVKILDVDLRWRMHAVSDGERRRVQLVMGLLSEWRVLFLDEVTVDLDLLCRSKILNWLKEEVSRRECTVVYATHILDGMEGWPSHLIHLSLGRVEDHGPIDQFEGETSREVKKRGHSVSRLGALLLGWLEEDLEKRGPREKGGAAEEMVKHAAEMQIGGYGFEKRPAR